MKSTTSVCGRARLEGRSSGVDGVWLLTERVEELSRLGGWGCHRDGLAVAGQRGGDVVGSGGRFGLLSCCLAGCDGRSVACWAFGGCAVVSPVGGVSPVAAGPMTLCVRRY
jgi:hypothetical protein